MEERPPLRLIREAIFASREALVRRARAPVDWLDASVEGVD